jgi:hypothetical protein
MYAHQTRPILESAKHSATRCGPQLAFWNIYGGGVGKQAGDHVWSRYLADGRPYPMIQFHVDTDPGTAVDDEDRALIQLRRSDVLAMEANPSCFGQNATNIIRDLQRMLDGSDILNGSRTTRALTQLAVTFHAEKLCRTMRRSLTHLREQFKVSFIMPVIISSSGGGTGSALQILLMDLLRQPAFRHRLLGGIPSDLLLPPMSFVCEPFAYVNETSQLQSRKIMANAMAFRLESEHLLQQRATSYVTHIGYANEGGTVLADPDLMARVLGNAVYEIERCWPALKARWVDGPDDVASMAQYGGTDSPQFDRLGDRWVVRRNAK